jgi:ubiquinone/menaquinone biosynthesis C-methylase UbiE
MNKHTPSESIVQESSKKYYNKYGQHYEEYHAYFRNTALTRQWKRNLERCKSALPISENMRAIDFGCGSGLLSLMLLNMGFSVTAIDISEVMLEQLRKKVANLPEPISKRIQYIHGGIESLEILPQNSFHLVCESSVLHHVQNYVSFLQLSHKLLIPRGVLYIGREPLRVAEQRVYKVNFPLNTLICAIDRAFDKKQSKGKFKEVFDESILPHYSEGGISCEALLEAGTKFEMEILFKRIYNWHRSKQAYFLDNILPRSLRFERFWGTFFDMALRKKMTHKLNTGGKTWEGIFLKLLGPYYCVAELG